MNNRYQIAERVADAVRETAEDELRRRAGDRLDEEEREDLGRWIRERVEEDVNGKLKRKAAEKHGHDIATDGGETKQALAARCAQLRYLADGLEDVDWSRVPVVDESEPIGLASDLRDASEELRHRHAPQSGVGR